MTAWRLEVLDPKAAPRLAETCAAWNHGQWAALRKEPLGTSLAAFVDRPRADGLPLTVVAVAVAAAGIAPGAALGMASLWEHDGLGTEDRTPWLASVFVHPDLRRHGLGAALVRRAEDEARRLGHRHLNLFTHDAHAFYVSLGWTVRRAEPDRVFMEKALGAANSP
jgi:GNAT superfamily N-acetyltransferase